MRWLPLLLALGLGCEDSETPCPVESLSVTPEILPFGELEARDSEERGDPNDAARAPHHQVVTLENLCGDPVTLSRVCLVLDPERGEGGPPHFLLEPPLEMTLAPGAITGIRVTYDRTEPNPHADVLDEESAQAADVAVLVIERADEGASVRVPLCGRAIAEGEDPEPLACPEPFPMPLDESVRCAP